MSAGGGDDDNDAKDRKKQPPGAWLSEKYKELAEERQKKGIKLAEEDAIKLQVRKNETVHPSREWVLMDALFRLVGNPASRRGHVPRADS